MVRKNSRKFAQFFGEKFRFAKKFSFCITENYKSKIIKYLLDGKKFFANFFVNVCDKYYFAEKISAYRNEKIFFLMKFAQFFCRKILSNLIIFAEFREKFSRNHFFLKLFYVSYHLF